MNTGLGSLSLLQGIFLTQELNQGVLHCRQILYQLSNQGSPARVPSGSNHPLDLGLLLKLKEKAELQNHFLKVSLFKPIILSHI